MITIYNKSNRSTYSAYLRRWNDTECCYDQDILEEIDTDLAKKWDSMIEMYVMDHNEVKGWCDFWNMVDQLSGPEEAESQEEKEAAGLTEEQLSGQKPKARRQYINAEDKEAITELYKAGREMEEIAEALGLYLSAVSRYI